jgi:glycogen(starch) synthase
LNDSIILHRVKAERRSVFSNLIVDVFKQRNETIKFDIIETPEYCAEGLPLRKAFPSIPMVVKLHTPIFLVKKLNGVYNKQPFKKRLKKILGRRVYFKESDTDFQLASSADAICSPSAALAEILKKEWNLNTVEIIPNIFIPQQTYFDIPISENDCKVITYIGRLDVRKGIKSLIEAIPVVLKKNPGVKFRFIGGDGDAPNKGGSMKEYILTVLHRYTPSLEFIGYTCHDQIPNYISDTGIFIIPSVWENYPYTCLEAMAAGKAIIASKNGGMKEMFAEVNGGILVNPLNPNEIAKAVLSLLEKPKIRIEMGNNNRKKMKTFSDETIRKVERYYNEIISVIN